MAYVYEDEEKWGKTGYSTGYGWNSGAGCGYGAVRAVDASKALQPLLDHIRAYDTLRQKLEREGGGFPDIAKVTELLSQPITLRGKYGNCKATLTDQAGLRTALFDIGNNDLHLDIRQLSTGMPVYYLCRIRRDYQSEHSLIVEDHYQSTGYPMVDERFVRMMDCGHETYYLRLSQFRDKLKEEGQRVHSPRRTPEGSKKYSGIYETAVPASPIQPHASPDDSSDLQIDDTLYHVGRHVFQAAWHEDQRPGVLAATHFGLPYFRQAIELLYLCLSGELCELRNATNERLLAFFKETYPQPAIHAFLGLLGGLDGAAINDLPRKALKFYVRLSSAFSSFLGVEVQWGHSRARVPLYKLVFGNFSRLDMLAVTLAHDKKLRSAAKELDQQAEVIVADIVGKRH
ncbi:MAG: hypothetical protein WCK89_06840 [bacterium]